MIKMLKSIIYPQLEMPVIIAFGSCVYSEDILLQKMHLASQLNDLYTDLTFLIQG